MDIVKYLRKEDSLSVFAVYAGLSRGKIECQIS